MMFALVDCDNFFCSCERVFRPDLAGRPVVVLSNNDGCVVARSAEAKAMGIPEGLPYFKLLQGGYGTVDGRSDRVSLHGSVQSSFRGDGRSGRASLHGCGVGGGVVAFSSNYSLYGDLSRRVMEVLRAEGMAVEQYSIDEAFIRVDGLDAARAKAWGEELCRRVERCTGVPVSMGIAATRTLAKMASRYAKTYAGYRKCCVVGTEQQREAALRGFPVGKVWGVGRRLEAMLGRSGVVTAWDLTQRSRQWVRSRMHVTGERTWDELWGRPVVEIDTLDGVTRKTIVTSRTLPRRCDNMGEMRAHVANYAARCASKLRRQGSVAGVVTVFLEGGDWCDDVYQGFGSQAVEVLGTAASSSPLIAGAALRALERAWRPGVRWRRAGCMVSAISRADALQPDLFSYDARAHAKADAVSRAIDTVCRRWGQDAVVLASQQYGSEADAQRSIGFSGAIRRSLKSPDYTLRLGAFTVG